MSTINIIIGIGALLCILMCYAFISQTLARQAERRKRVVAALKAKVRSFSYMLDGFPEGYLSKELIVLVNRSLVDTLTQLTKLEPNNNDHNKGLTRAKARLSQSLTQEVARKQVSLDDPQIAKDIRSGLEELFKFIGHLERNGGIAGNEALLRKNEIKQYMITISSDNLIANAKKALQKNKIKLAIHNYKQAMELLIKEGQPGANNTKVMQIKATIEELNVKLAESASANAEPDPEEGANSPFSSQGESWKKKTVYD